jgi:phospholipid transport system transporter-binding protein
MRINVSTAATKVDAKIVAVDPQQAQLIGRLDRLTGKKLLHDGRQLIARSGSQWTVDLVGVSHSSSVGIALLVDWQRYSQHKQVAIEFVNIPQKMKDVIEFSGLKGMFNLK